ncbi:protein phosphatase 2C domain-containing protein [Polyangium jinanense]|uniref:Protein phosphatase 2C domain-containing protein n=1 Tax=Polyangium jinanense TaxID=2829994 RepID=A0A9X3X1D0_9BACT|nr:protein phosphatase 2C domain-containing protein [Polyangium jinanense]MDC3953289.1 protein phosphatase 2C domain-containing protein [Polyangium jinanense]MDC3979591.1 protein phosphatase 2C domain-containing protein [Polyangium jinanense]
MKRKAPRKALAMTVETLFEAASSKSHGEVTPNEDVLLVSGHVYGVFDGARSGVIASEVFGERTSAPLAELCQEANRRIGEARAQGGSQTGSAAAVVRVAKDAFEWVMVGRSQVVVVRADGSFERLAPEDEHVLSGELSAEAHVRAGVRKLAGVRHLLLFTDGLLASSADEAMEGLVSRFLDGGLTAVRHGANEADVAAVAISFLPPNPVARKRISLYPRRIITAGSKRSSGVPSRRRRSRFP